MSPKKDLLLLLLFALGAILLAVFTLVRKYEHNTNFQTSKINPFHRLAKKQTKDIPVYLYHYVEHVTDERDFIRESLNIPPEIFESQVVSLKNAGYTFIFPNEIPDLDFSSEEKYAIVTFDDGYTDFYTDVLPILRKHQVKAVNYIIFNSIGDLNYMTKAQLQKVVKSGLVEIGAHTMNHIDLTSVSKERAETEIRGSKDGLEKAFGIKVVSFAYPYGFYNDEVKKMVEDAGFTTAVTVDAGSTVNKSDLFQIPRLKPGRYTILR